MRRAGGGWNSSSHGAAPAVVETIREEEGEVEAEKEKPGAKADAAGRPRRRGSSTSSSSSSSSRRPSPRSPASAPVIPASSLLRAAVEEWTRKTGVQPDAAVRIEGRCFRLHKGPLTSHSGFLRRRLRSASDLTIPSPSPASPDTFAAAALFCYGSDARLDASNVAALRVAAEWLQMSDDYADEDDEGYRSWDEGEDVDPTMTGRGDAAHGLLELTERCFDEAVSKAAEAGAGVAGLVQSCLDLIPRADQVAAGLAGRCMEAMEEAGRGAELGLSLREVAPGDFRSVAASIAARNCECHDVLYGIVDRYLQARGSDMTDEDKSRLCTPICCALLTRPRLVHLVQNPRMPLRFVVQAMLAEHYNTRRSLLVTQQPPPPPQHPPFVSAVSCSPVELVVARTPKLPPSGAATLTLGDVLEREAAARQQAGLRAAAEATSFRIYALERDIAAMRRKLREVSVQGPGAVVDVAGAAAGPRSQSCRFLGEVARQGKPDWGDYFDEEGLSAGTCSGRFAYEISDSFCDDSVRSAAVPANGKEEARRAKRRSSVRSAVLRGLKSVFRAAAWTGGKGSGGSNGGKRKGGIGCRGEGDVVSVGELRRRNMKNF